MFSRLAHKYKTVFDRRALISLAGAAIWLALALVLQYFAGHYTARTTSANSFVGDIFLDNLPVINLNLLVVEGALMAIVFSMVVLAWKPRYILFAVKATALFIIIRSFFITLTHLGIYPGQIEPSNGFFDQLYLTLGLETGYFFSAHTGLPFLMSLVFWDNKLLRWVYMGIAFVLGASVLISHVHYSIDVFAAPFMTYSIYRLARVLFSNDYARLCGTMKKALEIE